MENEHLQTHALPQPTEVAPFSPTEMLFKWNTGEKFSLSFHELRFQCPCASCVDEHTGKRTLKRELVSKDIRPKGVQPVGKYAITIQWTDGHSTGMYHFDRLHELCQKSGIKLS